MSTKRLFKQKASRGGTLGGWADIHISISIIKTITNICVLLSLLIVLFKVVVRP